MTSEMTPDRSAFHGTFIFPEAGTRKTGRLEVSGGRITGFSEGDAQPGDTALPGFITPGLIDAHVHLLMDGGADPAGTLRAASLVERVLGAERHLRLNLQAGVTTVRDLGGPDGIAVGLARAVAEGKVVGPHIVSSGRNITMTRGHGHFLGTEADGESAVRAAARTELELGAHLLKFMATGGVLTPGVRAGAEAFTEAELRAGIDTIEHGAFDAWDEEALELLRSRWLVPTLAAPDGILAARDRLPAWMLEKTEPIAEKHRENTGIAHRAGARIAAGTDAGTPFNPHGNLPRELELLSGVGLSELEVLQAATTVAADALALAGQVGTLNTGAWADLAVWHTDPLSGVRAYRKPAAVYARGRDVGARP